MHDRPKRSEIGVELVRRLAAEGERIFTTERAREIGAEVGLRESYLLEALYHLRRTGWIISLRRGLYALSSSLPGVSPAHEYEVAMALISPAAISHWSALSYHGLSEQAPRKVFVLTTTGTSIPRRHKVHTNRGDGYLFGDTLYQFVQIKPERFFGTEKVWIGETRVTITDPERTLLDGLSKPQYCGDFAEVLHAFEIRGDELELKRIIGYALRLDAATVKRLGWVLEQQGVEPVLLQLLAEIPVKDYRRLDPSGPRKGPCNGRWMIQENLQGKTSL
jgi:predicted transcriptional regulator of viral defense system